jgi:hypothetical protein
MTIADMTAVATPGADRDVVDQVQAAFSQMNGLQGSGTVDAHGATRQVSFDTSTVSEPTLKRTLESVSSQIGNLSTPFPSEPVGPGARWTARSSAVINGLRMSTTTTYTLRERSGNHYALDVAQDATAPPGTADIPDLPGGTQASIESFTLRTTGRSAGELTTPWPLETTSSGGGDGTFTVSQGAKQANLAEHIKLAFSLSPA